MTRRVIKLIRLSWADPERTRTRDDGPKDITTTITRRILGNIGILYQKIEYKEEK